MTRLIVGAVLCALVLAQNIPNPLITSILNVTTGDTDDGYSENGNYVTVTRTTSPILNTVTSLWVYNAASQMYLPQVSQTVLGRYNLGIYSNRDASCILLQSTSSTPAIQGYIYKLAPNYQQNTTASVTAFNPVLIADQQNLVNTGLTVNKNAIRLAPQCTAMIVSGRVITLNPDFSITLQDSPVNVIWGTYSLKYIISNTDGLFGLLPNGTKYKRYAQVAQPSIFTTLAQPFNFNFTGLTFRNEQSVFDPVFDASGNPVDKYILIFFGTDITGAQRLSYLIGSIMYNGTGYSFVNSSVVGDTVQYAVGSLLYGWPLDLSWFVIGYQTPTNMTPVTLAYYYSSALQLSPLVPVTDPATFYSDWKTSSSGGYALFTPTWFSFLNGATMVTGNHWFTSNTTIVKVGAYSYTPSSPVVQMFPEVFASSFLINRQGVKSNGLSQVQLYNYSNPLIPSGASGISTGGIIALAVAIPVIGSTHLDVVALIILFAYLYVSRQSEESEVPPNSDINFDKKNQISSFA